MELKLSQRSNSWIRCRKKPKKSVYNHASLGYSVLVMEVYHSSKFAWQGNEGSAFATDVFGVSRIPRTFGVVSARTANTRIFEYVNAAHDREGEVVSLKFVSKIGNTTLTIFND